MSIETVKLRKDVEEKNTWKLEDLFSSEKELNQAFNQAFNLIKQLSTYKDKLISSSHNLLEVLTLKDESDELSGKIYLYCNARLHQDTTNTFYQDLANKSNTLLIHLNTETSFISTELTHLTREAFDVFLQENSQLTPYKRYISEILRQKKHILDADTEALLSKFQEVAEAPSSIYAMFNNADIRFPKVKNEANQEIQITHGNYNKLLSSSNPKFRETVFSAFYSSYLAYGNTLAQMFYGNVKQISLFSQLHNYPSALESKLSIYNIPTQVYTTLIDTVNQELSIFYDYLALRKEVLELEELHLYDLFTPLVKEADQSISFDEACKVVLKSVEPLGEEYVNIVKEAFENRWIDKYENIGKRSGAYSWGTIGAPHPYVLMNYNDTLSNLFTLAHEMGHALHSYLSNKMQPKAYARYSIFVAEVASTVNESLLMQYLLKTTTDQEQKKYLLNHFMEQFRNTVYRQTMFAEFEKSVYDLHSLGQTLTTDTISHTYYDLVKKYHGTNVVIDDAIKIEWARIPHFYTPFYVYQYATGFSAAITLSKRILEEGAPAVKDYLNFLSSGSSKDPIDLLKDAGVDMTSSEPIRSALQVFKELIDEFQNL